MSKTENGTKLKEFSFFHFRISKTNWYYQLLTRPNEMFGAINWTAITFGWSVNKELVKKGSLYSHKYGCFNFIIRPPLFLSLSLARIETHLFGRHESNMNPTLFPSSFNQRATPFLASSHFYNRVFRRDVIAPNIRILIARPFYLCRAIICNVRSAVRWLIFSLSANFLPPNINNAAILDLILHFLSFFLSFLFNDVDIRAVIIIIIAFVQGMFYWCHVFPRCILIQTNKSMEEFQN